MPHTTQQQHHPPLCWLQAGSNKLMRAQTGIITCSHTGQQPLATFLLYQTAFTENGQLHTLRSGNCVYNNFILPWKDIDFGGVGGVLIMISFSVYPFPHFKVFFSFQMNWPCNISWQSLTNTETDRERVKKDNSHIWSAEKSFIWPLTNSPSASLILPDKHDSVTRL